MNLHLSGYPTLSGFKQCRQTKDGLRCMLKSGHTEKTCFNDIGFQRVFWDRTRTIKEDKNKEPSEFG